MDKLQLLRLRYLELLLQLEFGRLVLPTMTFTASRYLGIFLNRSVAVLMDVNFSYYIMDYIYIWKICPRLHSSKSHRVQQMFKHPRAPL